MKLIQCWVITVDTDGLVLEHQGICSCSAEYTPMCFRCLWDKDSEHVSCHDDQMTYFQNFRGYLADDWNALYSLLPGRSGCNFKNAIFNLALLAGIFRSCDNACGWMLWDFDVDKLTLVKVMAWCCDCCQAPSHYLNQCCPRSILPYGVTMAEWVKSFFFNELKATGAEA